MMRIWVLRSITAVVGISALACLGCFQPLPARAAGTVTNCLDNGSAGSLRSVMAGGGSVTFQAGLNCSSTGAGPITLTNGTLTIAADTTINATGATIVVDGGCTVDGGGHCTSGGVVVFTVNAGATATLNALTIQHGTSTMGVGGPDDGGGINNDGTLTVTNSTLSANAALGFNGNGGGIDNTGTLTVTNSTFSGNAATGSGGAIVTLGGPGTGVGILTVTNCTFSGNAAVNVSGNPVGSGGGIANNGGVVTVTSSTFSGNIANGIPRVGGIGGGITTVNSSNVTLTNTVVANSTDGDLIAAFGGTFSGNNNLIDDAATAGGFSDGVNGNIVGHPALLDTLGNNGGPTQTIPLLPGSPAIDAGAPIGSGPASNPVPATDQRGDPRIGLPDIGAFEATSLTQIMVTPASVTLKVGQAQQFTATGTYADGSMANITDQVHWSADSTAVTVDASGKGTGQSPGSAHVIATRGSVSGQASVTVSAPTPIGIAAAPQPASRPSSAGATTAGGAAPAPAPTGRSGS